MQIEQTRSVAQALKALPLLSSLDALYPDFSLWYQDKVLPGLTRGSDVMLLAWDQGRIAGIALGKKDLLETKLRCVRVSEDYRNSGLGLKLIDRMLDAIESRHPHCTVAEEMLHQYSRAFVNRYGFALSAVDKGTYRKGKLEYAFN